VIVRALLALGADTTAKNKRGQTPLDAVMASRKDSVKPLAELLRASATP
jgi:ankyrin repeat protein